MTDSLAELMADRPTPEQRAQAEAAIDKLTPAEQRRILIEAYATITAYGDNPGRLAQLARDIKATIWMRPLPGYREALAAADRRADERLTA
ncbi:MAG: hypothetical protein ABR585_07950 [Gemmatimonadaceae bacterium]